MLVDPSATPLALRLRQEIESLGLIVKWLPAERGRPPSLEQEAASADAVASIRMKALRRPFAHARKHGVVVCSHPPAHNVPRCTNGTCW
jgi:hypothetical protein